jgi:GT2 family glycosyltransferase
MSRSRGRRNRKNKTVISQPTPPRLPLPNVGVVVIGRNEGERLERCLKSIESLGVPTCYVDSGSTDGSQELAKRLNVDVVELSAAQPFTAARARNTGFNHLRSSNADLEFVQVLDGDTELQPDWLPTAIDELRSNQRIAAVVGRRRERFPDASTYNRMCDLEWDTPLGDVDAFGGDVLFRTAAWRDAGGYDTSLIAGEDPEFSFRLRAGGWKLRRIEAEMTLHDAAITNFGQWWKRSKRAGHAYAEGASMHGAEGHYTKEVRSIGFWAGAVPLGIIASVVVGLTVTPWAFAGLGLLLGYPLLWSRIRAHRKSLGDDAKVAGMYARFVVIGKFAELTGVLTFHMNRLRGTKTGLVEYKQPTEAA